MIIKGLVKSTLIDYPGKIACVVFTGGCNLKCKYCHNKDLVLHPNKFVSIEPDTIFEFLESRKGKLEGVVISGGEPTIQDGLVDFIYKIKQLDYEVKLDTNGFNPKPVKELVSNLLVDEIGLDFKGTPNTIREITQVEANYGNFIETLDFLRTFGIPLDVRTTVHRSLLKVKDLEEMYTILQKHKIESWTLQQYNPGNSIDDSLDSLDTYSDAELKEIASKLGENVKVRSLLS